MAALANLVITKDDDTTSITYTGLNPSSGDSTPAVWKSLTIGNAQAHQPELRLSAREGANGASRALRVTYVYPSISTNSTTGITSVIKKSRFSGEWVFDKDAPTTDINEFMSQLVKLLASTTFRSYLKSGYSAT